MNPYLFKFKSQIRVRNYEVDWQGIVHNAVYLLYFEIGRIEYLKNLGLKIDIHSIHRENKVVLVRNEINYKSPAQFDEVLNLYTRIANIRDTSFAFEAYIEEESTKRLIADNIAVHVWLDPRMNQPVRVSDEFRKTVQQFEGNNVAIDWHTYLT